VLRLKSKKFTYYKKVFLNGKVSYQEVNGYFWDKVSVLMPRLKKNKWIWNERSKENAGIYPSFPLLPLRKIDRNIVSDFFIKTDLVKSQADIIDTFRYISVDRWTVNISVVGFGANYTHTMSMPPNYQPRPSGESGSNQGRRPGSGSGNGSGHGSGKK